MGCARVYMCVCVHSCACVACVHTHRRVHMCACLHVAKVCVCVMGARVCTPTYACSVKLCVLGVVEEARTGDTGSQQHFEAPRLREVERGSGSLVGSAAS